MARQEIIRGDNISNAWAKVFLKIMEHNEISPLVVTVNGFEDLQILENKRIRKALDSELNRLNESSVHTVANTIFPQTLWNPQKARSQLYDRHNAIKAIIGSCNGNYNGHYFRRMIEYDEESENCNQLEHIIKTWEGGNHRHSALQIGIFDPNKDHVDSRQRGFPCLHQVSLDPFGSNGEDGLGVTGFYATQDITRKAYGNYLGLCRLGHFMAKEMGLQLVKMTCIAAKAIRPNAINKGQLRVLENSLKELVNNG